MRYKPLGKTGVLVSELCFGTMTFGREADEAESGRLFQACREAGVNFFDCANVYSDGLARQTFRFSIWHLSLLFAALLVDHYLAPWLHRLVA